MEQQKLPNATLILVFGIISIVGCCCYGIFGLVFGIVAIVLANKSIAIYLAEPEKYSGYQNVQTGRILAIIGTILSGLYLILTIWSISQYGWGNLQDPEFIREMLEQYQ